MRPWDKPFACKGAAGLIEINAPDEYLAARRYALSYFDDVMNGDEFEIEVRHHINGSVLHRYRVTAKVADVDFDVEEVFIP